jgi:hypothetical protein
LLLNNSGRALHLWPPSTVSCATFAAVQQQHGMCVPARTQRQPCAVVSHVAQAKRCQQEMSSTEHACGIL